jgi:hypothetical protein
MAQFQFDPTLSDPIGIKIDEGPIRRFNLFHYTANYDYNYRKKDEYGYDLPQSQLPIQLLLMTSGPYGVMQTPSSPTGWLFSIEADGKPNGTGDGNRREFFNCRQAQELNFE